MDNFIFYNPTKIYFGKGQINTLAEELRARAKQVLIVSGQGSIKRNGVFDAVIAQCDAAGVSWKECPGVQPNPRIEHVRTGVALCKSEGIDFILAVGGGSVLDASKAIAAGAMYDGDTWDFFTHKATIEQTLPLGTVVTLAATGSEMNGNAVVSCEETRRKLVMSSPLMRPVFSILDPEYTFTVNSYHTAAGIVDIMVHIFEQYFSLTEQTAVPDRLSEALLKVCIDAGPKACRQPDNYDVRAELLWAGTLALNDLIGKGKTTDWSSHFIEHELSALYDISHGAGLAIISPNWMRYVCDETRLAKFVAYGVNVWGIDPALDDVAIAHTAIDKTRAFFTALGMPATLCDIGITDEHFKAMADSAVAYWGSVGNFKQLSVDDIVAILNLAL